MAPNPSSPTVRKIEPEAVVCILHIHLKPVVVCNQSQVFLLLAQPQLPTEVWGPGRIAYYMIVLNRLSILIRFPARPLPR